MSVWRLKSKDIQWSCMADLVYRLIPCFAVKQWEGATEKKGDICWMYLHPTGILGATSDRLFREKGILEVKYLQIVVKKVITL